MNLRIHIALICLFSSFILFTKLGGQSVRPLDEAKWAQISREMIKSGDWITPRIGGRLFRHKPPLRMWLNTAAFCVFGENEFALRFWSALSGIGILISTYLLSYVLCRNTLIALASSLILLFSPVFVFEYLRMGDEHATFTFLFLLCLYCFWIGRENKRYLYFSAIFFGLSFLTYGFGAFFAPLIIFTYLIVTGEIKNFKLKLLTMLLLLSSFIILPWYIFQFAANGTNFLKIYLGEITYFLNADLIRQTNIYVNFIGNGLAKKMADCIDAFFFRGPDFYINSLKFSFFPWWLPLIFYLAFIILRRAVDFCRKKALKPKKEDIFIAVWFICVLSVLFIFKDKRSWRLYFLFPAFAILCAKSLEWFYRGNKMKLATGAAVFLLIALYNFRLFIPICLGPSCVGQIELHGLPNAIEPLATNNFTAWHIVFFFLSGSIVAASYILTRNKKAYLVHRISCLVLFCYLFFIGSKNTSAFFNYNYNKGKSDIDSIVTEIKKMPGIRKMIIYDTVLYNMEKGVIIPEYSLGGAVTADKGKHRWDSYYFIHGLEIKKEYANSFEDFKALSEKEDKKSSVFFVNRNNLERIKENKPDFLKSPKIERGDYVVFFHSAQNL